MPSALSCHVCPNIVGVDPDPANNARMVHWAKDYWLALHPYSAGDGYVNMMLDRERTPAGVSGPSPVPAASELWTP